MFRCDHYHQGAYRVSLLKLQCYNNWLKYIIVFNLVVWLHMLSGPCRYMSAALFGSEQCNNDLITYVATPPD